MHVQQKYLNLWNTAMLGNLYVSKLVSIKFVRIANHLKGSRYLNNTETPV